MAQQVEYYVDNVLQSYNPEVPNPDNVIILDSVSVIGYPDIVDRTNCQFKVYTDLTTEEEDTADYEEYMNCMLGGATALVDTEDNYLIDEDGNFIIE